MMTNTSKILTLISFFLFWYIYFAFLPQPMPVNVGLDPSWSYGISQAAQNQLIFGKEIVFTYGPLSYLLTGAAIPDNFRSIVFFQWVVYSLLFIVSIVKSKTIENSVHRVFFVLIILNALTTGTPYIGVGFSTDYQILFIHLIILSFDSIFRKHSRLVSTLLGATSGLLLLTKFTLGVYTFGSLLLFLLANLYMSFRNKKTLEVIDTLMSIINASLAFVTVSWIFLHPSNYQLSLYKSVSIFCVSVLLSAGIYLVYKIIKDKIDFNKKSIVNLIITFAKDIFGENHLVYWLIFYSLYLCLLSNLVFSDSNISLLNYFINSLEISSGYSSAMSIVGSEILLILALFQILGAILILILISKDKYLNLALSFSFVMFIAFKHGFVRHDAHAVVFGLVMPLIALLSLSKIKEDKKLRISYLLFKLILIGSIIIAKSGFSPLIQAEKLLFNNVISNVSSVFYLDNLQAKLIAKEKINLVSLKLPKKVINLVGTKPIDIIPWDISLVRANTSLNWKPRPIFQSYSAYTATLDNINFQSISKFERDYIFYNFKSIDERHPFFDEPKTFLYLLCNYEPSKEISDFITTFQPSEIANMILLKKLETTRCLSSPSNSLSKTISIPWNTPISLEKPNDSVVTAKIKISYSIIGKITKTLFRASPVMMHVDFMDGSNRSYRIIPENSGNGVIVSHLARDDREALSFFEGETMEKVKSFSFQTSNPVLYFPNIEIGFSEHTLFKQQSND